MKYMMLIVLVILSLNSFSQTIQQDKITLNLTVSFSSDDEEKAVKTSASLIASKSNMVWTTNFRLTTIKWRTEYTKEKIYNLYQNDTKIYSTTNVTELRKHYSSILIGTVYPLR